MVVKQGHLREESTRFDQLFINLFEKSPLGSQESTRFLCFVNLFAILPIYIEESTRFHLFL